MLLLIGKNYSIPSAYVEVIDILEIWLLLAQHGLRPPKRLLFGPGPSVVEPRAYEAMSQPVTGIRDPFFLQVMSEAQSGLRAVFGTTNKMTLVVPGSGSGAMEAAVANFVWPGTKFAVFANGHFSNRIVAMGERQGAMVVRLDKKWGEVFTEEEARGFIQRERPQVVAFVQSEDIPPAPTNRGTRLWPPLAKRMHW